MKAKDINLLIEDYCCWNRHKKLLKILEDPNNETVNLIEKDNYTLFEMAISYNHIEVLKILLNYVRKTKLQGKPELVNASKLEFQEILENAIDAYQGSDAAKELVQKYLSEDQAEELNKLFILPTQNSISFRNSNLQTSGTEYTSFESKTVDTSQVLPSELDIIGICKGENYES